MRRYVLVLFLLMLTASVAGSGLVVGSSQRDTLSFPFWVEDSSSNVAVLGSDSVYVVVFSPGGDVVFADSMASDDVSITCYDFEDWAGGKLCNYAERVSVLIGASTSIGTYSWTLIAHDISLDLHAKRVGYFQLLAESLDTTLARLDADVSSRSDLTESSNIGINLDDATGDFAAGNFGAASLNGKGDWPTSTAMVAAFDSLFAWAGWGIGNASHTDYGDDADTVWIKMGSDTLAIIRFIHPSGSPGDPPDSTKNEAKP